MRYQHHVEQINIMFIKVNMMFTRHQHHVDFINIKYIKVINLLTNISSMHTILTSNVNGSINRSGCLEHSTAAQAFCHANVSIWMCTDADQTQARSSRGRNVDNNMCLFVYIAISPLHPLARLRG